MTDNQQPYRYNRLFDPKPAPASTETPEATTGVGDRRENANYIYTEDIILAVNVALASSRPLLVRGPAGSGKSSLAADVARHLGRALYVEVISSRIAAKDLLWQFDALRRLRDAQAQETDTDPSRYIRPGVLWQAFDPQSAAGYSGSSTTPNLRKHARGAVVLLDEIDKADPDTPNDLLIPLGSGTFTVTDLWPPVKITARRPKAPLVVITTNEERDLPQAFVRRCVVLHLSPPTDEQLIAITTEHHGELSEKLHDLLQLYFNDARIRAEADGYPAPSTAEYLDAVAACQTLKISDDGEEWKAVMAATFHKWRST